MDRTVGRGHDAPTAATSAGMAIAALCIGLPSMGHGGVREWHRHGEREGFGSRRAAEQQRAANEVVGEEGGQASNESAGGPTRKAEAPAVRRAHASLDAHVEPFLGAA